MTPGFQQRGVVMALALLLCVSAFTNAQAPVDDLGDPLPRGVLLRIGSTRLRHGGAITSLVFSPDGKRLASGGADNTVRVWRLLDGKQVMVGKAENVTALDFAPDGNTLASGSAGGTGLWDVAAGRKTKKLPRSDPAYLWALRFSPDGKHLSQADKTGSVFSQEVATGKMASSCRVPASGPFRIALSADGKFVAAAGDDHAVGVWNVTSGKRLLLLPHKEYAPRGAAFSPDGRYLVSGGGGGQAVLWELATGQMIRSLPAYDFLSAFSPDGQTLASCTGDKLHLWDLADGKERWVLNTGNSISTLAFAPGGKLLATGDTDGIIRVWDHATGQEQLTSIQSQGGDPAVFLENGRRLVLNSALGLTIFDLDSPGRGKAWKARETHRLPGFLGVIAPDGKTAAATNSVILWDVARQTERCFLGEHERDTHLFAYAPDSRTVAVATGPTMELFDVATGKLRRKWPGDDPRSRHLALAFALDGKRLVSVSCRPESAILRFWNLETGAEIREAVIPDVVGSESEFVALSYSPSGKTLAIGIGENVQLWDAVKAVKILELPTEGPLAFSPDGRFLATPGKSASVQLWEVATGKPVAELRGHAGPATSLLFAPAGQVLAAGNADHTTSLWDLRIQGLFPLAMPAETDAERRRCWDALAGLDAAAAYSSLARLARDPAGSSAFLRERLQPVPAPAADEVRDWIAALSAANFKTRDRASADLKKLGRLAEPALRQALQAKVPLETMRRIEAMLAELSLDEVSLSAGATLRSLRGIHLLEIVGGAEARRTLEHLAAGAAGAIETPHARRALARLEAAKDH